MKQYAWIFYLIFLLIIYYSFVDNKKYQGETAEDWFYKYDEIDSDFTDYKNCVNNYAYSDDYDDLLEIRNCN